MKKKVFLGFVVMLEVTIATVLCVTVNADTVVSEDIIVPYVYEESILVRDNGILSAGDTAVGVGIKAIETYEVDYKTVDMPERDRDFKSYMDYRVLAKYRQKDLQDIAKTDELGFRIVDERYLVAVGTAVSDEVGTYITLVLENGTEINCIVGDIKDDKHTDESNILTVANDCVSEFIIDKEVMDNRVLRIGSVSYAFEEWKSMVVSIKVEDRNYFN